MNLCEILSKCDHTLLAPDATERDIKRICDEGIKHGVASVCIPPCYVAMAKDYTGGKLPICTVIGFPNGYSEPSVKVLEAKEAIKNGADEIDTVINIGYLKAGRVADILAELRLLREACRGKILKVIIETCLLTEEEKITMCRIVTEAGADFIKTSTGFSRGGATREDIALFSRHVGEGVRIKAAGGIASLKDAEDMIALGASRLGTSRIVKIAEAEEGKEDKNGNSAY